MRLERAVGAKVLRVRFQLFAFICSMSILSHAFTGDFSSCSDPAPLEAFSRTIRNYVPSSVPILLAVLSPPRVSPLVFFESFLGLLARMVPAHLLSSPNSAEWCRRTCDAAYAR